MDGHPLVGAEQQWEAVVNDMDATAAEYESRGWETLTLHPGDVVPLPPAHDPDISDQRGFDVVLPGAEFEALESFVADATFDDYEAYRGETGTVVLLLVAVRAPAAERVVLYPLYYDVEQAAEMLDAGDAADHLETYLRRLDREREVVFGHEDPEPLFPPGWRGDGTGEGDSEGTTDGTDGADAA